MSKKILSVMLALVLVLSTFAVSAFAAGTGFEEVDKETGEIASTQTWALSEPVKVSDTVYTVDVSLTTNYVVGAISFKINATEGISLTDVVINDEVITYTYDDTFNADGLVGIIPTPANEGDEGVVVDGKIATLTYTLAEGTTSATLTLVNDAKSESNPGGDLIAVRLSDNNLTTGTMIYGQRVLDAEGADLAEGDTIATVTIGEAAANPELVAKTGTTGYVDADKMYVYGVDAGKDPLNYFEATNNGYIEMTANSASKTNGTGATLTLYKDSTKAVVIETYTLIIFGDVDGSASINMSDANLVDQHINGISEITDAVAFFAADAAPSDTINMSDANIIQQHINGVSTMAANVRAA